MLIRACSGSKATYSSIDLGKLLLTNEILSLEVGNYLTSDVDLCGDVPFDREQSLESASKPAKSWLCLCLFSSKIGSRIGSSASVIDGE
jgi:hypothetical protein